MKPFDNSKRWRACLRIAASVIALLVLAAAPASAQTIKTWNVTSGTWNTGSNWDGGTATTASDIAYFSGSGAGSNNVTVLMEVAKTVTGLSFNSAGSTTLQSTAVNTRSIVIGTSGITMASTAGPVTIGVSGSTVNTTVSGTQTWTNNSSSLLTFLGSITTSAVAGASALTVTGSGPTTFAGNVTGSSGYPLSIRKDGTGLLSISGNTNNYAGGLTLAGGTVMLGDNTSLGTGTFSIGAGVSIDVNGTRTTVNNNAQVWNGDFTYLGGGTWNTGTGAVTLGGNRSVTVNASTLTVGGGIVDGGSGYSLTKAGAGGLTLSASNSYGGSTTVNAGTLTAGNDFALGSGTAGLTVNAGATLSIGSGVNVVRTGAITLAGGAMTTGTLTNNGSNFDIRSSSANVTTVLAGSGGITKSTSGTAVLAAANTYSGTTFVNAGRLEIANLNGLGSTDAGTVVASGAQLSVIASGTVAENLTIAGSGFGSSGGSVGAFLFNRGNGALTLSGTVTLSNDAAILTYQNGSTVLTVGNGIVGTGNLTLRGGAAANGYASFKLLGQSTYSGSTTFVTNNISGTNTWENGVDNALPSSTVLTMTVLSNGTSAINANLANYRLAGFNQTLAGLSGGATYVIGTGTTLPQVITGGATTLSTLTINNASNFSFAGTVGGFSGGNDANLALVKLGAGTQTLTSSNSYAGGTTLDAGMLAAGNNNALGSGTVTFAGGGLSSDSTTARTIANAIALAGNATLGDAVNNGPLTLSGPVDLGGATRTVTVSSTSTFSGAISNGGLTKAGSSLLALSGNNTFSGPTSVNAGTLAVNGSVLSAVNVANAAILGGAGTINGLVTVAAGGILAPGNSPGTLTMTSGLSLDDSSILNFELVATDTTVGGGINDLIVVTGNFLLDGVLNVAGTGDFTTVADNTKWRLFNYSGGTFTDGGISLGSMPSLAAGRNFQIDTATAGQVNLVIVPEPGAFALTAAGAGLAAAAWACRRRS